MGDGTGEDVRGSVRNSSGRHVRVKVGRRGPAAAGKTEASPPAPRRSQPPPPSPSFFSSSSASMTLACLIRSLIYFSIYLK